MNITKTTWPELNELLMKETNVRTLQKWLAQTMLQGGCLYRALRIHGRMSAVRREQELAAIHKKVA